jgi:REP element-mobilizing transposase RayT/DNA-binding CsgD family transcriptional regulator
MARPLRLEFAGALYHVTSRGDRREAIYEDDDDRRLFMSLLDQVCDTHNWLCHAYCLMGNHYHLLIETPDANLSKGMRQLNGMYTQNFNRIHNRVGHVFQGRYKAILVEKQGYLLEVARYIVLNPVRAQMVRSTKEWQWSSYRATAAQCAPPKCLTTDWLLSAFSSRRNDAVELYKQFVQEGKRLPSPWKELRNQAYLGSEAFVEKAQAHIGANQDLNEIPASQRRRPPKSLVYYEHHSQTRNQAIIEAYRSGGYTLKQIGDHFGLHYSTVSGIVRHHKSKT